MNSTNKKRILTNFTIEKCCGENCEETNNLKFEYGWNRNYTNKLDMKMKQLWCVDCYEEYTYYPCKRCEIIYCYEELGFYKNNKLINDCDEKLFFCVDCINIIETEDNNN